MAEERAKRRLAAILAADVVGYSRLHEKEPGGLVSVKRENFIYLVVGMLFRQKCVGFSFIGGSLFNVFTVIKWLDTT